MTLKWASALIAAAAAGVFGAANLIASLAGGPAVPALANLVLLVLAVGGGVLVVVADLYERLDARLSVVSDFLVTRLDDIVTRLEELDPPRPLEAVPSQADIVPFARRAARNRRAGDVPKP